MKLTTSNVVTGNVSINKLTIGNAAVVESLNLGNVNFTPSAVTVGSVSITPTAITTPSLIVGGTSYSGGQWGGIVDYQEFTTTGTWYNPYANAAANASLTGNEQVLVMAWGGGGGGAANGTSRYDGGGGGSCVIGQLPLTYFTNTCSVTVGAGGALRSGTQGVATDGGNTIFVINSTSSLIAYGGGGGSTSADRGGGGGGILGAPIAGGTGGEPLGGANAAGGLVAGASTFGGGGGAGNNGGISIFGGGGGAHGLIAVGGNSVYGGAGGGGNTLSFSIFGGQGGNTTVAPTSPGGGGGSVATSGQNGARGEVRVWVMGTAGTTAGVPTYTLTANTTTLYEGSSVLYTISTTNIANGTNLYYAINTTASSATSADFTTAVNGAIIINGGTGTFILTANNDAKTANEAFQIDVRTGSTTGSILASNGSVSIIPVTIQYIGGAGGDSTVTIPVGAQDNDLLVAFTFRDGNATPPSLPAGWTNIGTGANSASVRLCYKLRAAADTSVTFTNGTASIVHVYRGVNTASPIGNSAIQMNTSGVISWPAFTMTNPGGSWLAAAGHTVSGSGNGQRQVLPAGSWAVRESDSDATDDIGSVDSNAPVSSWSGFSFESNSGNDAGGAIVEIKNSL
jgi:hypothetical protein